MLSYAPICNVTTIWCTPYGAVQSLLLCSVFHVNGLLNFRLYGDHMVSTQPKYAQEQCKVFFRCKYEKAVHVPASETNKRLCSRLPLQAHAQLLHLQPAQRIFGVYVVVRTHAQAHKTSWIVLLNAFHQQRHLVFK